MNELRDELTMDPVPELIMDNGSRHEKIDPVDVGGWHARMRDVFTSSFYEFLSVDYRVSQVNCNIKNQHISAFRISNLFLKKDL